MTGVYVMVAAWWVGLGVVAWWMHRRNTQAQAAADQAHDQAQAELRARLDGETARRRNLLSDLKDLAEQVEDGLLPQVVGRHVRTLLAIHSRETQR